MAAVPKAAGPAARPLAAWPDVWYAVARSSEIGKRGLIDGEIAGRPYVIFRGEDGELAALDAYCPHMGAHLGTGRVVGNAVRCSLHHWVIGKDGHASDNGRACDRSARPWQVAERFGLIFLFAGRGPAPEPLRPARDDYAWIEGTPVSFDTDWRAMMVNAFDLQHMRTVHQRALVEPPRFSQSGPGALQLDYTTRVMPGGGFVNWLIKRIARDRIRVRQTCYGTTVVLESDLGRAQSSAVVGFTQRGGRAFAYTSFGTPRRGWLWRPRLWITRWCFETFLRKDYAVIERMRLAVDGVDDPGVRELVTFLRSLPPLDKHAADG